MKYRVAAIMIYIMIVSGLLAIAAVVIAQPDSRKSVAVFAIGFVLVMTFEGWVSYFPAHAASKASAVSGYKQYLNGTVVDTLRETFRCTRDGPCVHEYDCDPYPVVVTETYTDANGNTQTRSSTEIHYHDCPYTTVEYSYSLLVKAYKYFTIPLDNANHIFEANPAKWRKGGRSIPSYVPRGIPSLWQKAYDAIRVGDALPATLQAPYSNYILADERNLLKAYSDKIDTLRTKGLLPEHTARYQDPIHDYFLADKVMFVGFTPPNAAIWQDKLMRFNADFGTNKQGDMHVFVIRDSLLPSGISRYDYANAVKAYVQNRLGKDAFAKNGVGLVLGVDDSASTVLWSRSFTGMPIGNEGMINRLDEFELRDPKLSFDPDILFGRTMARVVAKEGKPAAQYTTPSGVVSDIVLRGENAFKRACMECNDDEEKGQISFVSLKDRIPIGTTGIVVVDILNTIIAGALWWFLFFFLGLLSSMIPGLDKPRNGDGDTSLFKGQSRTEDNGEYSYSDYRRLTESALAATSLLKEPSPTAELGSRLRVRRLTKRKPPHRTD